MKHSILKLDSTRHYLLIEHGVYSNVQKLEQTPVYDRQGIPDGEPGNITGKTEPGFMGEWQISATDTEQTWFDTNNKFVEEKMLKVGDIFLNGRIIKMLSYDDYIKKFPESIATYDEVSASTDHKGYIRKVNQTKMQGTGFDMWYIPEVKYSVNMKRSELAILVREDLN
jgi:hypothetical protein